MTRNWGPSIAGIQNALRDAIVAEQQAQAGSLPSPLHDGNFEVLAAVSRQNQTLLPVGARIFPPANSTLDPETTMGFEGLLTFPIVVHVKALQEADVLDLLREAQGLIIDAVAGDSTLGGRTGGTQSPGITLGAIDTDGLEATQELGIRFHVRHGI